MNFTKFIGLGISLIILFVSACYTTNPNQSTLKDIFKKYFLIGAALNDDVVSGRDVKAAEIAKQQFNSSTAENIMKWEHIHPELNKYNFEPADRFVDFSSKNNMFIIGHTLIWHNQTPNWVFVDENKKLLKREAMLARMKDHIFTVVGRYKGKIHGWDVVNEALSDEGEIIKSKWVETIGEDFIDKAFEYANQADPNAELYYNDFSLDKPAKRDAAVRLIRKLQAKKIRVDGVGIQGHWGMNYPTKQNLDAFIDSIASCGIKVMVTEMDIDVLPNVFDYLGADINVRAELKEEFNPYVHGLPDSMQQKLANRYAELFSQLLAHKDKISRVTFWGIYDKTSWLNDWPIIGRTSYPLLFDRNYQPKPAFYAILKTVETKK